MESLGGRREVWKGEEIEDGFFNCLKPTIQFGKIIGMIPFQNIVKKEQPNTNRFLDWRCILQVLVSIGVGVNAGFTFLEFCYTMGGENGDLNLIDIAEEGRELLFATTGAFIYFYFFVRGSFLSEFSREWTKGMKSLRLSQPPDTSLTKTAKWVTWTILTSMLIETFVWTLKFTPIFPSPNTHHDGHVGEGEVDLSPPLKFLWRFHCNRGKELIPFHPLPTFFLFLTDMAAFFSWNCVDLLVILTSRGIGLRFQSLVDEVERKRSSMVPSNPHWVNGLWMRVRRDHLLISTLLRSAESFLSPLILISFSTNLYAVSLQLHELMIPTTINKSPLEPVYGLLFLIHLIIRLVLITLFSAKMHDSAHGIVNSIQKWDSSQYSPPMERLERYLGSQPIAFTGLDCFVLSRSFVLVMFSILLTLEILLLQAHPPPSTPS